MNVTNKSSKKAKLFQQRLKQSNLLYLRVNYLLLTTYNSWIILSPFQGSLLRLLGDSRGNSCSWNISENLKENTCDGDLLRRYNFTKEGFCRLSFPVSFRNWLRNIFFTKHVCVTELRRKKSLPSFPKNEHFLPSDRHTYVCVSGVEKRSFFGKFGVLCFLVTSVLRFALLPYYRQTYSKAPYLIWICWRSRVLYPQ